MTATAIFFLPMSSATPTASLLSHITLEHPCAPLPSFDLQQHLFVNTSSLLPQASKPAPRQFFQVLTLSQDRSRTYLGTSKKQVQEDGNFGTNIIVIPTRDREEHLNMVRSRMQPLWAPRQSVTIEQGTSLLLGSDKNFLFRVGDVRVSGKSNQDMSVRGVLFEITALDFEGELGSHLSQEDTRTLKILMEKLGGARGVNVESMKMHGRYTETVNSPSEEGKSYKKLAELYIEFLRTMRS